MATLCQDINVGLGGDIFGGGIRLGSDIFVGSVLSWLNLLSRKQPFVSVVLTAAFVFGVFDGSGIFSGSGLFGSSSVVCSSIFCDSGVFGTRRCRIERIAIEGVAVALNASMSHRRHCC